MINSVIKLHPNNYLELHKRLIFYFGNIKPEMVNSIFNELLKAKTLIVTSYRKDSAAERRYTFYVGKYVLGVLGSEFTNLRVVKVFPEKLASEAKAKLYKSKIFTIIPSAGVLVVYDKQTYPEQNQPWNMDLDIYNLLLDSMENYFDAINSDDEMTEESIKIPEAFRRKIMRPFRDYTAKEEWVEKYKQFQGEGIEYTGREFVRKIDKGSVYRFFTSDENADPEKHLFNIGDRITLVVSGSQGEKAGHTGVLENIDNETSESTIAFDISYNFQTDDEDFPNAGKLVLAVNDTQTKVRSNVIRSLERGNVESKYMYKTFADFSTGGYSEIPPDLADYLIEKMAGKYPPNQMQLEAIIKGILTEDLLLVLGPPGTGKTTVISFWVEYFIRQKKRVLISSQNNAAVDNVLARFGKMAETVRLGNESKVQENCKPYLPHNKIASMLEFFNSNQRHLEEQMRHDLAEIERYKDALAKYRSLYKDYVEKSTVLNECSNRIQIHFGDVKSSYEKVGTAKKYLEEILTEKARRLIFLETYRKKNVFYKFFRKNYAKRVKRDLDLMEPAIEEARKQYSKEVRKYNKVVEKLSAEIKDAREQRIFADYFATRKALQNYTEFASRPEFVPRLTSEIARLYKPVTYKNDIQYNYGVLGAEEKQLDKLQQSVSKLNVVLSNWNHMLNTHRNDIMQNALLETCEIVGATCIGINSNKVFANVQFDVAIVDEAGQIQIHNALVPMSRARKNLLLGDHKQIPPIANEEVVAACEADEVDTKLLGMSFFEYVFEAMREKTKKELKSQGQDEGLLLKPVLEDYVPEPEKKVPKKIVWEMIQRVVQDSKKLVNLNQQFRMPGNISDIISEWFYEGNYYSSYDMNRFVPMLPGSDKPLVVVSTSNESDRSESQPHSKMGYQNKYEAQLVANMIFDLVSAVPEAEREKFLNNIEDNIGVISAYGAQVRLIRECISKKKLNIADSQIRSMVASLDSFQGQERPLIIYSLTRSSLHKKNTMGRVGFMKELRRLNVAFTRCQKQLVVVGDIEYLSNCMNVEQAPEGKEWTCMQQEEENVVGQEYIKQCAECPANCERKFARFMRLLMQYVNNNAGNKIDSQRYMERDA